MQILRLLWQYCQTAVQFGLRVDYESYPRGWATAFPPRGRLLTSHAKRAAGSRPSSACVEPLRRPLAVTAEWADSSASESACLHRGDHPTERAGSVVWAGTPNPVDLSSPRWLPPLQQSAASALPEGSHMPRAEEKSPLDFYYITISIAIVQARLAKKLFCLTTIDRAKSDPPVTVIRLWTSFGV